jgi:hypothetical protein
VSARRSCWGVLRACARGTASASKTGWVPAGCAAALHPSPTANLRNPVRDRRVSQSRRTVGALAIVDNARSVVVDDNEGWMGLTHA